MARGVGEGAHAQDGHGQAGGIQPRPGLRRAIGGARGHGRTVVLASDSTDGAPGESGTRTPVLKQMVAERERHLGADHPHTRATRAALAEWQAPGS
ncbi:hypothetical protein ABZ923_21910 [Streptomyces sp. NPDC046881]|uniref:hypothetical protein n=1 Tax=Streptomyces sp. NPDC046881 TaxID=3155374 RepID=UPI0033EFBCAA